MSFTAYLQKNKKIQLGDTSDAACDLTYNGTNLFVGTSKVYLTGDTIGTITAAGDGTNNQVTIGDTAESSATKDIKITFPDGCYFYYAYDTTGEELFFYNGTNTYSVRKTTLIA